MVSATFAFSTLSVAAALSGEEVHCLGGQAHVATYDLVGDSLETLSDAVVTVRPAPDSNAVCGGKAGDKAICVGANIDATCDHAAASIPVTTGLDCSNCYAGASMDFFYQLNISGFALQGVETGLRNLHLLGAAELHAAWQGSGPITHGTVTLKDDNSVAAWDFTVANIVPVHVEVRLPTTLDYSVDWKGAVDASAGVDVDVSMGDHYMRWTKDEGYSMRNTSASWTAVPFAQWTSGEAAIELSTTLHSSVQLDIRNVMWYHFNVAPSFPLELGVEHSPELDQACLDGAADLEVTHEADVHFTLLGHKLPVYHFGPKELYHGHKDHLLHKCVNKTEVVLV